GSTLLDDRFADVQWDVRPRAAWGAESLAGRGPWGLGARAWRATTTQAIGQPGAASADLALTTLEVVGAWRVGGVLGTDLLATATIGRLWLGYRPDQVTITPACRHRDSTPSRRRAPRGYSRARRAVVARAVERGFRRLATGYRRHERLRGDERTDAEHAQGAALPERPQRRAQRAWERVRDRR